MSILEQYRHWRQSNDSAQLFHLADRLDLLSDHERHIGSIHPVRQGQVARRVESQLGNPEQILANAIYLKLYDAGVQRSCYSAGFSDNELTLYCQLRSQFYWTRSLELLDPQDWETISRIESLDADFEALISAAIGETLVNCFSRFECAA